MAKADLHVHSKYSDRPSEWFLQKLGAHESYTEPETVYQICKERDMTFVTITDHNDIRGSLEITEKYPDTFSGVESTTYFPEDGCKVHLLIYGMDGRQFEEIQRIRRDIYQLRDFLVDQQLAHSLAHATYSVNRKLSFEHLEKLILLFDVFEAINGGRSKNSSSVWFEYLKYLNEERFLQMQAKHGIKPQRQNSWIKGFTGGSDDHAGIFIGQTFTLAGTDNVQDYLNHIRDRRGFAKGRANNYQGFAFAIYKIAHDYSYKQNQSLLKSFSLPDIGAFIFGQKKVSIYDRLSIARMKADSSSTYKRQIADLIEIISREKELSVEKNLQVLYEKITTIGDEVLKNLIFSTQNALKGGDLFGLFGNISSALPGMFLFVPFFSSLAHLSNQQRIIGRLRQELPTPTKRKILWFTDTLNDLNGVSVTLKQLGWQFFANGIDVQIVTALLDEEKSGELPPNIINLPVVATIPLPYYDQYILKFPSVLYAFNELQKFDPDEIIVSTPGPLGLLGVLAARLFSIPITGIYHTDFASELKEISSSAKAHEADESAVASIEKYTQWFYSLMDDIKVPTQSYMDILAEQGFSKKKMSLFPRQINTDLFSFCPPEKLNGAKLDLLDGLNLLYVGRISKDKNLDFLMDVYKTVREKKDDVNLIFIGDGPFIEDLRNLANGDDRIRILGKVSYEILPQYYSQADMLVFPSVTDTFGMVVLEAQCCELPTLVSDIGGPQDIIQDNETGFILPALNLEAWTEKILEMDSMIKNNNDQYLEMRHQSRRKALTAAGWDLVLKQLISRELKPTHKLFVD